MRISDWSSDVCSSDLPDVILGKVRLNARIGDKEFVCRAAPCGEAVGAIWWQDGALYFLQAGTSENGGTTTLGRWRPDREVEPDIILSTKDALLGCQPIPEAIVCARETATPPRTHVRTDPANGEPTPAFDTNTDLPRRHNEAQ